MEVTQKKGGILLALGILSPICWATDAVSIADINGYVEYEIYAETDSPIEVSVDYKKIKTCRVSKIYGLTDLPHNKKIVTVQHVPRAGVCRPNQDYPEREIGLKFKVHPRPGGHFVGTSLIVPEGSKVEARVVK